MINSFDGIRKSAHIVTKMGQGFTPTNHQFKKIEIGSNRNSVHYPASIANGEAYADLVLHERTTADLFQFTSKVNNKINGGVENSKIAGVFLLTILNNALNSALYFVYQKLVKVYSAAGYIPDYLVKMQEEVVSFAQALYKSDVRELWILDKKIAVRSMQKTIANGIAKLIALSKKYYLALTVVCLLGFLSASSTAAQTNSASYMERATAQNATATLAAMTGDVKSNTLSELQINTNPNAKVTFIASHQVSEGETLESLSTLYNINTEIIAFNNNLDPAATLEVGRNIYVPATNAYIHYADKATTKAEISRIYKVSEADLDEYNPGLTSEIEQGKLVFVPVEDINLIKQYKQEEENRIKEEAAKKAAEEQAKIAAAQRAAAAQAYAQQQRQTALSTVSYSVTTNVPKVENTAGTTFIWPTDTRNISCGWYCYGGHTAIDLPERGNPPIYASAGGYVSQVVYSGVGYGNHIMITHANGYVTLYAHLSSIGVSVGQYVDQGQVIGRMGTTGNSTGEHLHFEVRKNGTILHPLSVLP